MSFEKLILFLTREFCAKLYKEKKNSITSARASGLNIANVRACVLMEYVYSTDMFEEYYINAHSEGT